MERFIRGIGDRIHFTKGRWTDMLKPALKKYNSAIHSSTGMKPSEAHDDDNRANVKANLTLKQNIPKRKRYLHIKERDQPKVDRKETQNRKDRKRYNITNLVCLGRIEETLFAS